MPDADWKELYKAALVELNPSKLAICIQTAEQAIAKAEMRMDISPAERSKLADARCVLQSLSRFACHGSGHVA
jgi:hypothetical protein